MTFPTTALAQIARRGMVSAATDISWCDRAIRQSGAACATGARSGPVRLAPGADTASLADSI
jgi:hypothetical protein